MRLHGPRDEQLEASSTQGPTSAAGRPRPSPAAARRLPPTRQAVCRALLVAAVTTLIACADDPAESSPGPTGGGGTAGCPAGEVPLGDGTCLRPGVPDGACGEGFRSDSLGGCEPILPVDPCPPGQIATPGDEACAPLADCGAAPWGNIPVTPTTQHVDGSYAGGDSDGTAQKPWTTISAALSAADAGAVVAVAAGQYDGDFLVDSATSIWGRCPDLVTIVGTISATATVWIAADGVELHQLAITGPGAAIAVRDAVDVRVENVRVYDTGVLALQAHSDNAPTSVTLSRCIVEDCTDGIVSLGSEVVVEDSLLRRSTNAGQAARGATAAPNVAGARSHLTLAGCVVEENVEVGVLSLGSDLDVERSVVRRNLPVASGLAGMGIAVARYGPEGAVGRVTQSVISDNRQAGIDLQGSSAALEHVTVRDTWETSEGSRGFGVNATENVGPAVATVRASLVERAAQAGLISYGSVLDLEATTIRDTRRTFADVTEPSGGVLVTTTGDAVATATLRHCLITGGSNVGAAVVGGDLSIAFSVVAEVQPSTEGDYGHGVHVQGTPTAPGRGWLSDLTLTGNHSHGVLLSGAETVLERLLITDTKSVNGRFGDGISLVVGHAEAAATVSATRVAHSQRAGVASFGAALTVVDTQLECNTIDLVTQTYVGQAAQLNDGGGNRCGCGDATVACKALSPGIEAPAPLAESSQ